MDLTQFQSSLFRSLFIKGSPLAPVNKLVILMHGLGDRPESYVDLVKEINVTGACYLLLQAPFDYPIGFSWYDVEDPIPGLEESGRKLKMLIDELETIGVSSEDIFIGGFSQGAALSVDYFLNQEKSRKVAGIISLSGKLYRPEEVDYENREKKQTPFFVAHGEFDDVINSEKSLKRFGVLKEGGYNVEIFQYPMSHEVSYDEIVDLRNWINEYL